MKKMLIWIGFTVIWLFVGCQKKTIQNSFTSLSICDVNEIRETRTINLSEWVEDFQIIRFENSDTALFRMKSVAITDNSLVSVNMGRMHLNYLIEKETSYAMLDNLEEDQENIAIYQVAL